MFDLRCDLSQQLKPFSRQSIVQLDKPGNVAPWPTQTADVSVTDRIDGLGEYNRNDMGCLMEDVRGPPPTPAKITSGLRATNSLASLNGRGTSPMLQRYSMRKLRPTSQPAS